MARATTGSTKRSAKPKAALSPGVADTLRTPATRSRALAAISSTLLLHKRLEANAAPTLSFLLALLADPETVGREQILAVAELMLHAGDPSQLQPTGLDSRVANARFASGPAHEVRAAILAALPTLRTLLQDAEPRVRAGAASLLGYIADAPSESADALLARLAVEDSPAARARIVFACMVLPRYDSTLTARIADALSNLARDGSLDATTRGAVAIARAFVTGAEGEAGAHGFSEGESDALRAFFAAQIPPSLDMKSAYNAIPQNQGELDNHALAVLGALGARGRWAATEASLAALEEARVPATARVVSDWTNWVLHWYFPLRTGDREALVEDPLPIREATSEQRRALEALSKFDAPIVVFGPTGLVQGATYVYRGLPNDVRARRRLVGLEPEGVLERVQPCALLGKEDWPRSRTLVHALRAYQARYGAAPLDQRASLSSFVEPYFPGLSAEEWLELWTEVDAGAYGLSLPLAPKPPPVIAALHAVDGSARARWLSRYLDEIERSPDRELSARIGAALSVPLLEALAAGASLPSAHERIIPLTRDALERLPEAQRLPFLERRVSLAREQAQSQRALVLTQIVQRLLELVPDATRLVLAELNRDDLGPATASVQRALAQVRPKS